jgi:hypothetical protein
MLDIDAAKRSDFRNELEDVINRHSMENGSDTPDFILAQYLSDCLETFDKALVRRERWYGREPFHVSATSPAPTVIAATEIPVSPKPVKGDGDCG